MTNKTKLQSSVKTKDLENIKIAKDKSENIDKKEKDDKPKKNKPKLDAKTKFWIIFLTIITFGFFQLYLQIKIKNKKKQQSEKKKAVVIEDTKIEDKPKNEVNKNKKPKKLDKNPKAEKVSEPTKKVAKKSISNLESSFKVSDKIPFALEDLVKFLGSKENIREIDASLNSLKVLIKDKTKVDQIKIKELGAKGIMLSSDKVSIIFGDYATILKEDLGRFLKAK